jgi:hypothetical protein
MTVFAWANLPFLLGAQIENIRRATATMTGTHPISWFLFLGSDLLLLLNYH